MKLGREIVWVYGVTPKDQSGTVSLADDVEIPYEG